VARQLMVCPYCGRHSVGINPSFCVACGRRWPDTLLAELRRIEREEGYKPGGKRKKRKTKTRGKAGKRRRK